MFHQKPLLGTLPNFVHPLTPTAAWIMNEGSGNKVYDIINGNHGTFGVGILSPAWKVGMLGSILDFNTGDYVDCGNNSIFNSNDVSVIILINFKARNDYDVLISKRSKSGNTPMQWSLGLDEAAMAGNDELFWGYYNGNWRYIRTSGANLANDVWYHITATRNGNVLKAYVDGQLLSTYADNGSVNPAFGTETVRIGDTGYGNAEIDCYVAMASVYNHALNQSQISQLSINPYCWMAKPTEAELMYTAAGGQIDLAGMIPAAASIIGNVYVDYALAGQVSASASILGLLGLQRPITGSIDGNTTVGGSVVLERLISGNINALSTLNGIVKLLREIDGQIHGSSSLSAETINLLRQLSGQIQASSSLLGSLGLERPLSVLVSAVSHFNGNINILKQIQGIIDATSNISGQLALERLISGNIAGIAGLTGDLTITGEILLAGSADASSIVDGKLNVLKSFSGSLAGSSALTGNLNRIRSIYGDITAQSAVSGKVNLIRDISGDISAVSEILGAIQSIKGFTGIINAQSQTDGSIKLDLQLTGDINAISELLGTLKVSVESTLGIISDPGIVSLTINRTHESQTQKRTFRNM